MEAGIVVAAASAATTVVARLNPPSRAASGGRPRTMDQREAVEAATSPELVVRVLGPVEVQRDGVAVALGGRDLELVAYLATHPRGVTEEQIRTALWWDRPVSRGRFNNLVSDTRRQLGTLEGEAALPVLGDDRRYRLHPRVGCDLRLLDSGSEDLNTAALVLGAVRGRPFDAERGFGWADRDGLAGWASTRIADTAHHLASVQLAAGRPAAALQAAERGLLGAPGDETLFRDRMLAHVATGDLAAARRVGAELLASFSTGEDPAEVLHPETIELIGRLGRYVPFSRR